MASTDYSGLAPQRSVVNVLKIAGAELRELRAHYKTVSHRIRALRTAVDALRKFKGNGAVPVGEVDVLIAGRSDRNTSRDRADIQRVRIARNRNPDLRRACRIALLETLDAASDQEIYARIARRGSFCFSNAGTAIASIVEELNALANQGEVRRFYGPPGRLWQRISPKPDQGDATSS